ncbi:MAG: zf-HC2 domain-containing protein, partial [Planctomycetes bacterium]|nr:zf-HC2 domain-containing protein [Planctomycetota bacterium]
MSTESREELISAYLDGELSDDERAQVEKWLAESAPLRQFHDELRALRLGMQS